jgi:hypothetical protein
VELAKILGVAKQDRGVSFGRIWIARGETQGVEMKRKAGVVSYVRAGFK